MYSLDEYKNRYPRDKGRNHSEYNQSIYQEWRLHCLNDARRSIEAGELESALRDILQVLEEE